MFLFFPENSSKVVNFQENVTPPKSSSSPAVNSSSTPAGLSEKLFEKKKVMSWKDKVGISAATKPETKKESTPDQSKKRRREDEVGFKIIIFSSLKKLKKPSALNNFVYL